MGEFMSEIVSAHLCFMLLFKPELMRWRIVKFKTVETVATETEAGFQLQLQIETNVITAFQF